MRFRGFYLPFFRRYLPQYVQQKLDLNRLQPVPNVVAGPRDIRASDSVFRCPLEEDEGWFYSVVECQATNDNRMDYRTQEYKTCVFQYHLETVGKTDPRPPWIFSIVVYMGPQNVSPLEVYLTV